MDECQRRGLAVDHHHVRPQRRSIAVDQPYGTLTQPVRLMNPARAALAKTAIM